MSREVASIKLSTGYMFNYISLAGVSIYSGLPYRAAKAKSVVVLHFAHKPSCFEYNSFEVVQAMDVIGHNRMSI